MPKFASYTAREEAVFKGWNRFDVVTRAYIEDSSTPTFADQEFAVINSAHLKMLFPHESDVPRSIACPRQSTSCVRWSGAS